MKELGPTARFLGIQILRNCKCSIHLVQDAYIAKVLDNFNMQDAKTRRSPLEKAATNDLIAYDVQAIK